MLTLNRRDVANYLVRQSVLSGETFRSFWMGKLNYFLIRIQLHRTLRRETSTMTWLTWKKKNQKIDLKKNVLFLFKRTRISTGLRWLFKIRTWNGNANVNCVCRRCKKILKCGCSMLGVNYSKVHFSETILRMHSFYSLDVLRDGDLLKRTGEKWSKQNDSSF